MKIHGKYNETYKGKTQGRWKVCLFRWSYFGGLISDHLRSMRGISVARSAMRRQCLAGMGQLGIV